MPERPAGLVVFAHGSGSSRFSRRNRSVAQTLENGGFATLLIDLLTRDEEQIDAAHRGVSLRHPSSRSSRCRPRSTGPLASLRLSDLPVACFGASTGAAAALIAAASRPNIVRAVISRGGRPDLAADVLPLVIAPTLLIVGERDDVVIELNRAAMRRMHAPVQLEIVPGATHLFEEPGALELVSQLALRWCRRHVGIGA